MLCEHDVPSIAFHCIANNNEHVPVDLLEKEWGGSLAYS